MELLLEGQHICTGRIAQAVLACILRDPIEAVVLVPCDMTEPQVQHNPASSGDNHEISVGPWVANVRHIHDAALDSRLEIDADDDGGAPELILVEK
eukprot:7065951-Prymnesium_polylepis.1